MSKNDAIRVTNFTGPTIRQDVPATTPVTHAPVSPSGGQIFKVTAANQWVINGTQCGPCGLQNTVAPDDTYPLKGAPIGCLVVYTTAAGQTQKQTFNSPTAYILAPGACSLSFGPNVNNFGSNSNNSGSVTVTIQT